MNVRVADLPWLVEPPENYRDYVRSLRPEDPGSDALARHLAGFRLNANQLHWLGRAISRLSRERPEVTRLGILSNGTTDLLGDALTASALRHGIWAYTITTGFDQIAYEALDPSSRINQARCHIILLAVDHRGLPFDPSPGDLVHARETVGAAVKYTESICAALRHNSKCTVIVQTIPQVASSLFGSLDRGVPGSLQWLIEQYNLELRAKVSQSTDALLDTAMLAETVGLERWHDPSRWVLGKFPFALDLLPLYGDWVGRLVASLRGTTRKCLVLDLDNTIWGGVIGDDGLEGIILGNGNPLGESFLSVQRTALELRDRGIVLAVSSKNEDSVARSPFRLHPEMLLRERHIAVFQANWQDKPSNLRAIAATLRIGIESLVLLDDNVAERAQVREALPTVAVPELPSDPAFYSQTLLAAGYFEATGFTSEDRQRADQYQANAARVEVLSNVTDLRGHLQSLGMKAICSPFDRLGRTRIAQLINKSNQFNLTTRRYTELDVETFENSRTGLTLQIRLLDRFGDNGTVAIVICREVEPDWIIDTWLMSCRVLNRQLEQATLNYVASRARLASVRYLIGHYFETGRNAIVRDHYARLGFEQQSPAAESGTVWRLAVATYSPCEVPIEIVVVP